MIFLIYMYHILLITLIKRKKKDVLFVNFGIIFSALKKQQQQQQHQIKTTISVKNNVFLVGVILVIFLKIENIVLYNMENTYLFIYFSPRLTQL